MQIYKITNLLNGKIYIGKDTKNWKNYYGSGILIKVAIKKYGRENFRKDILEDNIVDKNLLCEREKFWIKKLQPYPPNGYNIADGGQGNRNLLDENPNANKIRKHLSDGQKKRYSKKEERKKTGLSVSGNKNGMYGKKHSKETLEKMSLRRKNQCKDDTHIKKISDGIKESIKNMPLIKCEYCGKYKNKRILNQYHKNGKCIK